MKPFPKIVRESKDSQININIPKVEIIKENDLNANKLLVTNTFEIGYGWLNIPVEIIHGKFYVELKDGVTYQKIISDDVTIEPMHRHNGSGEFIEWSGTTSSTINPFKSKIDYLTKTVAELQLSESDDGLRKSVEELKEFSNKIFAEVREIGLSATISDTRLNTLYEELDTERNVDYIESIKGIKTQTQNAFEKMYKEFDDYKEMMKNRFDMQQEMHIKEIKHLTGVIESSNQTLNNSNINEFFINVDKRIKTIEGAING